MKIIYFFIVIFSFISFLYADSLHCVKYGESTYSSKYIFFGDKENKQIEFDWLFYLIVMEGKKILVDCGFYSKNLVKIYEVDYKDPILILQENGFSPQDITDLIITHAHFDHIENAAHFTKANIYIQEDELNFFLKDKFSNKSVVSFLKSSKNIIAFKENYDFSPKMKIKKIGGHSVGSSIVEISFNNRKFILASDECYLRRNYRDKIGVGAYYDHKKNMDFINGLNENEYEILLFHEAKDKNLNFFLIYED
ncbi:MAG TPA: MBL fold metallo-hydrolase [Spirochaetota bacterium]|nr:MBL fold metallo-hydrolase [Spirochaetota bacterium]